MSDLFVRLLCATVASLIVHGSVRADTGEPPRLQVGAGTFTLRVGADESRDVEVYYYRPRDLTEQSPVLIVLPGAGRNAWDYRQHWIDASEQFGVLVLSLHYPESRYPRFWNYNLAGMIADVAIEPSGKAMNYRIVTDRRQWLFDDIDRIFESAVRATGLKTKRYDLFGHSAGGQFLHRFALFADRDTKADRILAANSGWYTVPDSHERFPYGLAEAPMTDEQLSVAFARHLVVFLGGSDDENETRGDLVRNAQTDRQGTHRLARGKYFYARAGRMAARMNTRFNWTLVVEPGVGHDPKRMAGAAARYLYGQPSGSSLHD
jgi:poly(3-hydroxybutyrate) depolymerase